MSVQWAASTRRKWAYGIGHGRGKEDNGARGVGRKVWGLDSVQNGCDVLLHYWLWSSTNLTAISTKSIRADSYPTVSEAQHFSCLICIAISFRSGLNTKVYRSLNRIINAHFTIFRVGYQLVN